MTVSAPPVLHISPQLSIGDAETVATWFLRHGGGDDWRARLMADLPVVYARVYPGVDPEAIVRNVRAALERTGQEQADAFAALAGKHLAFAGREHTGHFHDPSGRYDYCTDPQCPRAARPKPAYGDGEQATLRRALEMTRELTEPDDPNGEYIRGQANLIMDTFSLYCGDGTGDDAHDIVTRAIMHQITVDAALSELAALTGAEV